MVTSLLFLIAFCLTACSLPDQQSLPLYNSGEHLLLADAAYRAACRDRTDCPQDLVRADGKQTFSYGELVAFSGDFYRDPDDLYFETPEGKLSALFGDVAKLKEIALKEALWAEEQVHAAEFLPYPDWTLQFVMAYPHYINLSLENIDHFGWHNMKAYVRYHGEALERARQASNFSGERRTQIVTEALFINAFADHFLSDAFAAGHIRNPRADSLEWGERAGHPRLAMQTLAKLVHDRDHLLPLEGGGLNVQNARGDVWQTRSDGQLFSASPLSPPHLALPIEALKLSLGELLETAKTGTLPEGIYGAAALAPFLSPAESDLSASFHPDIDPGLLAEWLAGLGIISKLKWFTGLKPELARDYFRHLPQIMESFRERVRREARDPTLNLRLPLAYREAYENVR